MGGRDRTREDLTGFRPTPGTNVSASGRRRRVAIIARCGGLVVTSRPGLRPPAQARAGSRRTRILCYEEKSRPCFSPPGSYARPPEEAERSAVMRGPKPGWFVSEVLIAEVGLAPTGRLFPPRFHCRGRPGRRGSDDTNGQRVARFVRRGVQRREAARHVERSAARAPL